MTVIFFAISLTALLALAGLILGGSTGYTAARNAQTAADAAALAGATALQTHKTNWVTKEGGVSAAEVSADVASIVEANGAVLEACDLVNPDYALTGDESDVIAPCDDLSLLEQDAFLEVAGVRVRVSDTRSVPFAAFVDEETIAGRATAAAAVQPLGEMRAPFLLCGTQEGVKSPLLVDESTTPPTYSVNPKAIGTHYVLWGNDISDDEEKRSCGLTSSDWRGLAHTGVQGAVGGWWSTLSGNKVGQLPTRLTGATSCDIANADLNNPDIDELIGCEVPVPICIQGRADPKLELRCVLIGSFRITAVKGSPLTERAKCDNDPNTNIVCAELVGDGLVATGRGIAAVPGDQVVVVRLVQ